MSKKEAAAPLSEKEISQILKTRRSKANQAECPLRKQVAVDKIVQRAKTECSAKAVAEYTLISMWTAILEFVALFCVFINQKRVNKNNLKPKD